MADDLNQTDQEQRIPDAVAEFVHECIDRLETLKVLFLLRATAPRVWSIHEVSVERQSSEYSAEISIRHLLRAGLLVRVDRQFRFEPQTTELSERAAALAWWYQAKPNSVMRLIFHGWSS